MTSVHYWASPLEANLCAHQEVALVGAGNSAGQATVYLASRAKKVWLLARGGSLEATMSRYLVDRIRGLSNVEVLTNAEVTGLEGSDGRLEAIRWRCNGSEERCEIRHLFLFIGADPNTDWLRNSGVHLDDKGFILTGANGNGSARRLWKRTSQVCSPSATCARDRSSASQRPSAKVRRSSPRCMPCSPTWHHRRGAA